MTGIPAQRGPKCGCGCERPPGQHNPPRRFSRQRTPQEN